MILSGLVDAVIGLVSILWFFVRYIFTRTRCSMCKEKIMSGELKYRVKEQMSPDNDMCYYITNPVCTRCTNKVRSSGAAEITCINE